MSNSDNIALLLERAAGSGADDATVIAANAAFRRASGHAADWLLGRLAAELFVADADALMKAIRGNVALRTELACKRADGGSFMLGLHLMPAPARAPGRDCFVILGRDITETLRARQMQDTIQHLLAKVFSSVDAAVGIVSGAGRIVMANPHLDVLLGYAPNGLIGRSSLDIVAPDARARVAAIIKQQAVDGCDTTHSAPVLRADGSHVVVRITSVVATPGDSKQLRILTLRPDVGGSDGTRGESVGRIKLVGLDAVRAALGERWPALAERAMTTAEAVIKRHCGSQDSYSRVDETSFVMCFGRLSEAESAFRAAMIGREIRNRLIGQGQDPDSAYVRSVAAMVRVSDEDDSGAALHALLLGRLNQQLDRIEADARKTLHEALTCATCELGRVFGRSAGQVVALRVSMPAELERRLVSAVAALPPAEAKTFDLDGLLLGLAAQRAIMTMGRGETTPLIVTLGFDIFATRTATERFFTLCTKIDARITDRLILVLSELPAGLPRARLQDCVNRLRPYCRAVGYEVEDLVDVARIDLSNSFNPVVILSAAACAASTPDAVRAMFMSVQSQRAKVMIRGVASEKDATTLRSLGADMIAMKPA
jgi:PAS domain S-box-containing protein